MKWHIEKKSLIHYSLKKGCKLMHPFLLSVFISCIYFELIFKMKRVDNTSANPRISIAGNAVPKKIAATIVAATGSTLDNNPAYTFPIVFVRLIPLHTFYTCQISLLYSAIVRSDEKNPAFAMFTIIFFAHVIRSS